MKRLFAMDASKQSENLNCEDDMVEIRWYVNSNFVKVLQYRYRLSSAKYGSGKAWSDWTDVETVMESDT
jgi:hypothetical protein